MGSCLVQCMPIIFSNPGAKFCSLIETPYPTGYKSSSDQVKIEILRALVNIKPSWFFLDHVSILSDIYLWLHKQATRTDTTFYRVLQILDAWLDLTAAISQLKPGQPLELKRDLLVIIH